MPDAHPWSGSNWTSLPVHPCANRLDWSEMNYDGHPGRLHRLKVDAPLPQSQRFGLG